MVNLGPACACGHHTWTPLISHLDPVLDLGFSKDQEPRSMNQGPRIKYQDSNKFCSYTTTLNDDNDDVDDCDDGFGSSSPPPAPPPPSTPSPYYDDCEICLVVIILSSIIQCSMIYNNVFVIEHPNKN